jgi:hypothetical protein
LLLVVWLCATMGAHKLAPGIGERAAAAERALGLHVAIPDDDED